jgi:hypothetical protein
MKPILFALAIALSATVAAAQAQDPQQQPQPPSPTFRSGVDVITVDIGAVDGRGQPVTDLHAPEFTVKIDGQVRRIVSADLIKYKYTPDDGITRRPEPKQQQFESLFTTNITEPEGRMIMIAVDQMNIRPGAARPILESAARFLDKLNPADRVAFVSYPEPGVVVDFTSDHQRLRLAMQKVIGTQSRYVGRRNIGSSKRSTSRRRATTGRMQEVTNRECRGLLDMALEQCMRDIVDESNSIPVDDEARHGGIAARPAQVAAASRRDGRAEDTHSAVGRPRSPIRRRISRRRARRDARPRSVNVLLMDCAARRRHAGTAAADLH